MRVLACLALVACGRVGFDPHGDGATRDSSDGATNSDAPMQACSNFGAFAAPAQLDPALQSPNDDWDPTPTRGGLEIVWYICVAGCSLQHSTRITTASPWSAPAALANVNIGGANSVSPTLTEDGAVLVFASDVTGTFRLYETTRATPADDYAAPMLLATTVGAAGSLDRDVTMTPDGLRIVFASTRTAGLSHIFEATRPDVGSAFSTPVERTDLENAGQEVSPALSSDGLEILFSSIGGPVGGMDIYRATRTSTAQPFAAPVLVSELSSPKDDLGMRLSPDGATVYFDYNALATGGMNSQLWAATRTCQ